MTLATGTRLRPVSVVNLALAERAYGKLTKLVEHSGFEGLTEVIAAARKRKAAARQNNAS